MTTTPTVSQAFNAHAESYDRSLQPILAVKEMLHLLIRWQFSGLPDAARVLVAGAGTGAEARFLAPIFPRWQFTLVDPSEAMLAVGQRHAQAQQIIERLFIREKQLIQTILMNARHIENLAIRAAD